MFLFGSISAEMLQMGRFKSLLRHQGRMEGCIARGNSRMMIYWERWVDLWLSEGGIHEFWVKYIHTCTV
jgi:hypothetical protein